MILRAGSCHCRDKVLILVGSSQVARGKCSFAESIATTRLAVCAFFMKGFT